jgi:hypothetical protein
MGKAILSTYNNDRFYRAVGVVTINATFLKSGWEFVYFNTLALKFDDKIIDLSFSELIKLIRREIHSKDFVNPEAKRKLLKLADKSIELNSKRNTKIHASILGGGNEFYIQERKNKVRTMEILDENKIKEIEDIGDEIAKHGRTIHEIPYEKEYYKLKTRIK